MAEGSRWQEMKMIGALLVVFGVSVLSLSFVPRHTQSTEAHAGGVNKRVQPVVVELFTSEGCSSCPPADALLAKVDSDERLRDAEIIALEEHVDYWDSLGWRDPFSARQWTGRQEEYARSFGNEGVYTPQMVVDGRTEFVGSSESKMRSAIDEAARRPKAEIVLSKLNTAGEEVRLQIEAQMLPAEAKRDSEVWLGVTETGLHSSVKAGENKGEDLHHAAVVRSLGKVGEARAGETMAFSGEQRVVLDPRWKRENLRLVVFLQDPRSKHILGASAVRLMP